MASLSSFFPVKEQNSSLFPSKTITLFRIQSLRLLKFLLTTNGSARSKITFELNGQTYTRKVQIVYVQGNGITIYNVNNFLFYYIDDLDNDGIPTYDENGNILDLDIDGDGCNNENDFDVDNDGCDNENDYDIDDDGRLSFLEFFESYEEAKDKLKIS